MARTGTYDFSKGLLFIKHPLYEGVIMIDGFMKDSNVTIAREEPRWKPSPSGDGKTTTHVRNPINAGSITFVLNQSTDSIAKMNAICQHSDISDGEDLLFEITYVDQSSGSIHFSNDAIVGEPETIDYGQDENGRQFQVQCGSLSNTLNGSAKISQETLKILQAFGYDMDASRVASY